MRKVRNVDQTHWGTDNREIEKKKRRQTESTQNTFTETEPKFDCKANGDSDLFVACTLPLMITDIRGYNIVIAPLKSSCHAW